MHSTLATTIEHELIEIQSYELKKIKQIIINNDMFNIIVRSVENIVITIIVYYTTFRKLYTLFLVKMTKMFSRDYLYSIKMQ